MLILKPKVKRKSLGKVLVLLELPQVFLICAVRVENDCAKQYSSNFYRHMDNARILK